MVLKFSDERVREWWQSMRPVDRMRAISDLRREAYHSPWTRLHLSEQQRVRDVFQKAPVPA